MEATVPHKQFTWVYVLSTLFLLACVAVFSYTKYYFVLALPFGIPLAAWLILHWKSFYWFYLITIPFTAIVSVGGSSMLYLPQLPLTILLAAVTVALLLTQRSIIREQILRHPLSLILLLQYLWLIVSVIFSEIFVPSIKYLGVNTLQLLVFFLLPSIVVRSQKDVLWLLRFFLFPLALISLFIFARHGLHFFSYNASNLAVKPFFYNHVDHATVLSMAVPVFYILWRANRHRPRFRWLYLGLFLFFIVATYVTYARGAILGMAFAFVVLFAIRKKLLHWFMPLFFLLASLVVVLMAKDSKYIDFRPNFEQTYTRHSFTDLIKATFTGGDMSSMERFYRWIAAVRMSEQRPITGVGPNNFYYYYKPHAVTVFKTYVSRNPEKSTTHNYFLFLLVEQGWPAMLLYGLLISALFYHAQRLYHATDQVFLKRMVLACAMVIAAFFVNNLLSELLQTYKIGAMFYLAIVLLLWVDHQIKQERKITAAEKNGHA